MRFNGKHNARRKKNDGEDGMKFLSPGEVFLVASWRTKHKQGGKRKRTHRPDTVPPWLDVLLGGDAFGKFL